MEKTRRKIKLYISSLNGHRAGEFIATGLRKGFIEELPDDVEVVYNKEDATHAIIYATLANNDIAKAHLKLMSRIPTLLLHDDYNIPKDYNVCKVIEAKSFNFIQAVYYTNAYRYRTESHSKKEYEFVYGGTFKPSRLGSYLAHIPDKPSTLLIGSDRQWDEYFPNTTRMKTIKDMEVLYATMAKAKRTFIAYDPMVHKNVIPLRALEPHMCNLECKDAAETITRGVASRVIYNLHSLLVSDVTKLFTYNKELDNKELETIFNAEHTVNFTPITAEDIVKDFKHAAKDNIDELLADRGNTYGSYDVGVDCRATIMHALNELHIEKNGKPMCEKLRVALSDVVLKIMRAVVSPTYNDSWDDLAGYSKLISEMVNKEGGHVFDSSRY